MSRPDHDAAPGRPRHARRRAPVVPVTVGVLGIAFVGMVVGTVTSTAWLAIAAPIVMMFVGIDAALGRVLLVADVPTPHVIDRARSVGCLCRVGLLYHGVPAFHLV